MKYYLAVFVTSLVFFIFFFGLSASYLGINYNTTIGIFRTAFFIFALITFIFYKQRSKGELFGETDRYIFLIILAFLDFKDFDDEKKLNLLKNIFKSYAEKQILKLFNRYKDKTVKVEHLCLKLKSTETRTKIFVIYSLFDVASYDKLLSKEEEEFILNISKLLGIPKQTYLAIKKIYIKKGLNDEEELKQRAERKKFVQNFSHFLFPYDAYKILGVSPSVTKAQLKKTYRTLAKKYHPDKYAGKSDAEIQKAEEKFQEIKEAYDVILKNKKY